MQFVYILHSHPFRARTCFGLCCNQFNSTPDFQVVSLGANIQQTDIIIKPGKSVKIFFKCDQSLGLCQLIIGHHVHPVHYTKNKADIPRGQLQTDLWRATSVLEGIKLPGIRYFFFSMRTATGILCTFKNKTFVYKVQNISLASRVSMCLLKKLTNFIHFLNPKYFLIYLLFYTKNSSLLCFMHNKRESVSKRLHFNEYIFKNMDGKWNNYSALVYVETETQRLRFCLISAPAALGTLYHQWRNCHFFHNVISKTNLSSWSFQ